MKWLNAFIAVLKRPTRSAAPAYLAGLPKTNAGDCHSATITSGKHTPDETRQQVQIEALIRCRAIVQCNRDPVLIERNVAVHTILARGK